MSDLIDRAIHDCWSCVHHSSGVCDTWCDYGESYKMREDVAKAPSVPSEHNDGYTFYLGDCVNKGWYCSVCRKKHQKKPKFCSNCGAKLKELRRETVDNWSGRISNVC